MKKESILFYDISDPVYLPVVKAASLNGFIPVINQPKLARLARASGIMHMSLEQFVPADIQTQINQHISQIGDGLCQVLQTHAASQTFSSSLGNFLPHSQAFFNQLIHLLPGEITAIETLENLMANTRVCLIVLGCDNSPTQRALIQLASQKGIPTLLLAHGITWTPQPLAKVAGEMFTLFADYVASYGQRAKDILVALGNAPERIMLTGAATWDTYYLPEARMDRRTARRTLGLDPDNPW
jgi:hypothetical protein